MMKIFLPFALLLLVACGNNPIENCAIAHKIALNTQLANIAAQKNAANNPQSANMQKLAQLAEIAADTAAAAETRMCGS